MRIVFLRLLRIWLVTVCLAAHAGWAAQELEPVSNPSFQILDLVFKVEDLGGKVLDLKVIETATEIRIEFAADVLFDFDKGDVRPDAQNALKQAAAIIKDKAKGTVRIEGHTDAKGAGFTQSETIRAPREVDHELARSKRRLEERALLDDRIRREKTCCLQHQAGRVRRPGRKAKEPARRNNYGQEVGAILTSINQMNGAEFAVLEQVCQRATFHQCA